MGRRLGRCLEAESEWREGVFSLRPLSWSLGLRHRAEDGRETPCPGTMTPGKGVFVVDFVQLVPGVAVAHAIEDIQGG